MIRQLLTICGIALCAVVALLSAGALLQAQGVARLVWFAVLVVAVVLALRRWAAAAWWPIVLHASAAILLGILLGTGAGGAPAALGLICHVGAALLWWVRPHLGAPATILLAGASLAFATFAVVFHWICGGCFGVHALMAASVILLHRRAVLAEARRESIWQAGVSLVAASGIAYVALTCVPGLTRDPHDRALLALLAQWQEPLSTVTALPAAAPAAPVGIELGSGEQTIEVFLAADQVLPPAERTAIAALAAGGYRVRVAMVGGATGARARAVAWTAAAGNNPSQWATLLDQEQIPAPPATAAPAAEALVAAATHRTASLQVRRLPAYALHTTTGTSLLTSLASLQPKGPP
jgi:hypothetical protein